MKKSTPVARKAVPDTRSLRHEHHHSVRAEFLARARAIAVELCKRQGTVTADDVRQVLAIPASLDPRIMGAVFMGEAWESIGHENSRRTLCHRRPIQRFRLAASSRDQIVARLGEDSLDQVAVLQARPRSAWSLLVLKPGRQRTERGFRWRLVSPSGRNIAKGFVSAPTPKRALSVAKTQARRVMKEKMKH